MLFIFQRGGNDGINSVIREATMNTIPPTAPPCSCAKTKHSTLATGFQLHPRLEPMMEIFNSQKLNGKEGPGNLAIIHRVGYLQPVSLSL